MLLIICGFAAVALAQSNSGNGEAAQETVPYLDPDAGYPESVTNSVLDDMAEAPPGTTPGPVIEPDEVHVPNEPPAKVFVDRCKSVAAGGTFALDGEPLCRTVLLMDSGQITPGVYKEADIKRRFDELMDPAR